MKHFAFLFGLFLVLSLTSCEKEIEIPAKKTYDPETTQAAVPESTKPKGPGDRRTGVTETTSPEAKEIEIPAKKTPSAEAKEIEIPAKKV